MLAVVMFCSFVALGAMFLAAFAIRELCRVYADSHKFAHDSLVLVEGAFDSALERIQKLARDNAMQQQFLTTEVMDRLQARTLGEAVAAEQARGEGQIARKNLEDALAKATHEERQLEHVKLRDIHGNEWKASELEPM